LKTFLIAAKEKKEKTMSEIDDVSIDEIMASLKIYSGVYEQEMVDAAISREDEIIPRLIEVLRGVLADPEPYLEDEDLFDHIYAVMLLGHLKATEAHRTIVDLFSLPGEIPDDLFGDITTSDLPMILLRTCGGSLDFIRAMALNRDASDYCRNSALQAMTYAVVEGIADRKEMLDFFGTLFTGEETDPDSDFWGCLACNILELYPEESMDVIKNGYQNDLISPGMVGYEDFEIALEEGKEKTLSRLKANYDRDPLDDIHASMSWWNCFQPDEKPKHDPGLASPFFDMPDRISTKVQKKKNTKKKKKKRKQAKASKRKNRR
jgi:hypothetical protein